MSGKGTSTDTPKPHALRYFTADPFLRDDGGDFGAQCTPRGRAECARTYSVRTEVQTVGVLAGYRIIDVLYSVNTKQSPGPDRVNWKSILVRVGPDRYREIFHLQNFYSTVSIMPSQIIQSGRERVLATMDRDGGNGGDCWEGYWWFDPSGPHPLDFSRLHAAIQSRVPKGLLLGITCSYLDLSSERVQSWVQKADAQCHACDYLGKVTAQFRLNGPILEPAAIDFEPTRP
jgi:hypothetical protein